MPHFLPSPILPSLPPCLKGKWQNRGYLRFVSLLPSKKTYNPMQPRKSDQLNKNRAWPGN